MRDNNCETKYMFPYYLFPRASKVVICGSNEIGQEFYRQALQDEYVEIVGLVDKNPGESGATGAVVEPLVAVKNRKYDYVLLTADDAASADEFRKELVKLGVPARCICWDGEAYSRDNFVRNMYIPMLEAWNSDYGSHDAFLQEFSRKMSGSDYDHVFPYHMFRKGAKVVIYGAGEVGKKFYRQAVKDKYVNIVGIVDKNAGKIQTAHLPVKHAKRLLEMEYDYVLVAVRNPKGMEDAKKTLLSYNVPTKSIVWDGEVYLRGDFNKNTYLPMMEAWNAPRGEWQDFLAEYQRKINGSIYDHVFPYHLFYSGARVVLYGAGDVANKFYLQGKKDGIVDIVGFVAETDDNPYTAAVPVEPIEALRSMSYNYVLIAVRNSKAADVARKKLIELGVPAGCIKWDGAVYLRDDFYHRIYAQIVKAYPYPADSYQEFVEGISKRLAVPAAEKLKVSVIVPVYNLGNIIRRCIGNLLSQSMQDFEVIFVDDASTDDTVNILTEISKGNEKIRIVQQESNGGAGAARNLGIQEAKGEYIIFLDGDDEYSPYLLEKASHALDETGADLVAFNFRRIYADGTVEERIGIHEELLSEKKGVFNYTYCPNKIMSVVNPTPWNKMYRLSYLRRHQLKFEEISSANDITFASVSVAYASNIAYIKDVLYSYHVGHSGTITATKAKTINNIITAVKSGYAQVQKLPYFEEISAAAARFMAENLIYGFDNYVKDWSTEESKQFYNSIHQLFNDISTEEIENGKVLSRRNTQVFLMLRDVNYEEFMKRRNHRLIVSLTSFPARIEQVYLSLETLLRQTRQPDEIVLWLADTEFSEEDIPKELLELERDGNLSIRWCDDLKPHKKYFYAFQEYSDDIVVTVDDDIYYPVDMLDMLYLSYIRYPRAVSAGRTRLIAVGNDGKILPYDMWPLETDFLLGKPSMQLVATGCGGVLYPPHCFSDEFFDMSVIRELCLRGDDLWLKMMEIHAGIPVVQAMQNRNIHCVEGTQGEALWTLNVRKNQNDMLMEKIIAWYDGKYGKGAFERKLLLEKDGMQTGFEAFYQYKIASKKRRVTVENTASELVKRFGAFFTARIDVFLEHATLPEFMLTGISDSLAKVSTPKWAQNGRAGYSVESYQGNLELRFRSSVTGEVQIKLLGCDVKNPQKPKERLERWIDYANLIVNSQRVLNDVTAAWHDKPYVYSFQAHEGDEIIIKAEWLPHIS